MARYPEVQRKAQAEIDQLTGSTRLPRFEDRDSLPYIEALYREVSRWKQPMPLACAHALTEDDYYKGYFIPKGIYDAYQLLPCVIDSITLTFHLESGTMVIGNAWSDVL